MSSTFFSSKIIIPVCPNVTELFAIFERETEHHDTSIFQL